MIRGWIIFSSLVLSVLFRLWLPTATKVVGFPFSEESISIQSWVYFTMEHIIAVAIAACLLIQDSTPRKLLWLFLIILCVDLIHYWLFYRDPGIGFNLAKVLTFAIPLTWIQLRQLFHK
jgi:hypothetical protein